MIKTPEALRRFSRDGNRLYKGGGGGDGGAAARDAAEKERVSQAVKKINAIFQLGSNGVTDPASLVDRSQFTKSINPSSVRDSTWNPTVTGDWNRANNVATTVFDKAGYDAAVAEAKKNASTAPARESLYTKIGDDTKNTALVDLGRDRDITQRDLGFMLARAGLSGGSRDVDVNRDILDTYNQGVLKAANMGTETANNARSADDQTRVKLIQNIQAGLDEGQAAQQAYEGMANNARSAQDDANSATLKGFFDILNNQQKEAAYTTAYNQAVNPYAKNTNTYGGGANKTYGGTSRSLS